MENLENTELDADLQEFEVAQQEYGQRFGRSMIIDLITLVNSQDLQSAVEQNEELANFIQSESGKYAPIAEEYMQSYIDDIPAPMAEGEGMPTEEAGRPEMSNEQMMQ